MKCLSIYLSQMYIVETILLKKIYFLNLTRLVRLVILSIHINCLILFLELKFISKNAKKKKINKNKIK